MPRKSVTLPIAISIVIGLVVLGGAAFVIAPVFGLNWRDLYGTTLGQPDTADTLVTTTTSPPPDTEEPLTLAEQEIVWCGLLTTAIICGGPGDHPELTPSEFWVLAVSQSLANEHRGGLTYSFDPGQSWQDHLLAVCSNFDHAADRITDGIEFGRLVGLPPVTIVRADNLTPLVYAWHAFGDLNDVHSDIANAHRTLGSGDARGWLYRAIAATELYCPEYQRHLQRYRPERVALATTLRRCQDAWDPANFSTSCIDYDDQADRQ